MGFVDEVCIMQTLARSAQEAIPAAQGERAKTALLKLIAVDIDDLRRAEDGLAGPKTLQDCKLILKEAKQALQDLESGNMTADAKNVIDRVVALEDQLRIDASAEEKRRNELYQYWHEKIFKGFVYHGTNSIALPLIKRQGLVPGAVPWPTEDIDRLDLLLKKSGWEYGIGAYYNIRTRGQGQEGIFVIMNKKTAESYASRSPEMWSEFVRAANWKGRNKEGALRHAYYCICYRGAVLLHLTNEEFERRLSLFPRDSHQFEKYASEMCSLSREEVAEILRIFEKLWNFFSPGRPVVLHISTQAPALLKEYPYFESFPAFLDELTILGHIDLYSPPLAEVIHEIEMSFIPLPNSPYNQDIKILEAIPAHYILRYEEIRE